MRVSDNTPEKFMMKICDLVEVGTGQPAIYFDNVAMEMLKRNGVEDEDLWNWCVAGCVEPQIPGKTSLWQKAEDTVTLQPWNGLYTTDTARYWKTDRPQDRRSEKLQDI